MARDDAPGRPARFPATERAAADPALQADPDAAACQHLWQSVLAQALADAASRSRVPIDAKARADARRWLLTPSASRALVCELAGIDPAVLDREDVRARLLAAWERVDARGALDRSRHPVVDPDGRSWPSISVAAKASGLSIATLALWARQGRGGWSLAA